MHSIWYMLYVYSLWPHGACFFAFCLWHLHLSPLITNVYTLEYGGAYSGSVEYLIRKRVPFHKTHTQNNNSTMHDDGNDFRYESKACFNCPRGTPMPFPNEVDCIYSFGTSSYQHHKWLSAIDDIINVPKTMPNEKKNRALFTSSSSLSMLCVLVSFAYTILPRGWVMSGGMPCVVASD